MGISSLLLVTITNCIIQLDHAHRIFGGNIFCANGKNPPPPLSWNNSITEVVDTIAFDHWNHNAEGIYLDLPGSHLTVR